MFEINRSGVVRRDKTMVIYEAPEEDMEPPAVRVRRAATQLFAEKGYHATGVAELGGRAGLGAGALYHHIGSKQDLLFEIVRGHLDEALAMGHEILASEVDTRAKLRLMARGHMHLVATRTLELRVTMREINSLEGAGRVEILSLRDDVERIWTQIIDEGVESGELAKVDPLLVKALLGAFNFSVLWFRSDGAATANEVADRMLAMFALGRVGGTS